MTLTSTLTKKINIIQNKGWTAILQKLNTSSLNQYVKALMGLVKFRLAARRKIHPKEIELSQGVTEKLNELKEYGYTDISNIIDNSLLEKVLSERQNLMQHSGAGPAAGKSFWERVSDPYFERNELNTDNPLVQFALQTDVLKLVANYLKSKPFLSQLVVTNSIPNNNQLSVSQLWHNDKDDTQMCKLFIYLSDVKESNDGPFTLIDAKNSRKVKNHYFHRHLHDSEIEEQALKNKKEIFGKAGSCFIVDTSRCYHMGSRVQNGHQRLLYTALYISLPSVHPWADRNWVKLGSNKVSPLAERTVII